MRNCKAVTVLAWPDTDSMQNLMRLSKKTNFPLVVILG